MGAVFHILLIDDNAFFTATFAALLKRTGYRVSVARDHEESRQLQNSDPADLVLMGIYLRKRTAEEYLEDLQSTFAGTPVIGLFSDRDKKDSQYSVLLKELGLQRAHHKPFRTEDLLECVHAELALVARRAC
jgi:DNA-binding response OmpR family regulator